MNANPAEHELLLRALRAAPPRPLADGRAAAFPEQHGAVYLFTTPDDELTVYVGLTGNLRERMGWHATEPEQGGGADFVVKLAAMRQEPAFCDLPADGHTYLVRHIRLDEKAQRAAFERFVIGRLRPPFNRALMGTPRAAMSKRQP
jgi:hypothetical protein